VGAMRKLLQAILAQVKGLCKPPAAASVGPPLPNPESHEAAHAMMDAIDNALKRRDGFFKDDKFAAEKMER
jgi:hypothetical protein